MRTHDQIATDEARLKVCAGYEALLDEVTGRHHGRSPEELAQWLPGEEGDRLRQLLEEVKEWSRECSAVEVQR